MNAQLPCAVLSVRIVTGPSGGLSPLEQLVIRAVEAGVDHIEELTNLFGIGHRPLLDLLVDLWRRGYALIDPGRARVRLSSQVASLLKRGKLAELEGGLRTDAVVRVMQDCVTGSLLPLVGFSRAGRAGSMIPSVAGLPDLSRIDKSELVSAAELAWRRQFKAPPDHVVHEAWVGGRDVQLSHDLRWLPIKLECLLDPASDLLSFQVFDAHSLSREARTKLGERLAYLAQREPDELFFRRMREAANKKEWEQRDFPDLVKGLAQQVKHLDEVDPGLVSDAHARLTELADEALEAAERLLTSDAEVRPVVGHEAHESWVQAAIAGARDQLVLVCPWIRYRPLNDLYLNQIKDALRRGCRIYLLWGIDETSSLPEDVGLALDRLKEFPNFRQHPMPSRTHAKVVIQDDSRILVTSYNFLAPSQAETLELGLSLEPSGQKRWRLPAELLEWARRNYPDYLESRGLLTRASDFDHAPRSLTTLPSTPEWSDSSSGRLARVAVGLWAEDWRGFERELAGVAAHQGAAVEAVVDGEHSRLLWHALRSAKHRLVVASDKLSPDVVQLKFVDALRKLLQAGVHVALLFRRPSPDPLAKLTALAEEQSQQRGWGRLTLRETTTHAKLLIHDDTVLISSFNFLSFQGHGAGKRRERSEVGVRVSGGSTAREILTCLSPILGEASEALLSAERAPADLSRESDPVASARRPPSPLELVRRLGEAKDEAAQIIVLRRQFTGAADPWLTLDALQRAGLPSTELRLAALTCLAVVPEAERSSAPEERWRTWLAREAWRGERWHEALVLAYGLNAPELPPAWLRRCMALAQQGEHAAPRLIDSLMDGVLAQETAWQDSAAALSLEALLLHGSQKAAEELLPSLKPSEPLQACSDAALRFWGTFYLPLPIPRLARRQNRRLVDQGAEAKRVALGKALADTEARGDSFNFVAGKQTWGVLFAPSGPLGRLRSLQQQGDVAGARAWLEAEGKDTGAFLDRASESTERGDLIIGRYRRQILGYFKRLFSCLRDWIHCTPEEGEEVDQLEQGALEVVGAFSAHRDGIEVALSDEAFRARFFRVFSVLFEEGSK